MTGQQQFQARDHSGGTLEVITILPALGANHPVLTALRTFARKFRNLIFTLDHGAFLEATSLMVLIEVSSLTNLKIVTENPEQLPFRKAGLSVLPTIQAALQQIRGDETASKILKEMEAVPQLNSSAFEILQRLNRPETDFAELEKLTNQDPGLASQILKSSNSAFFMRRSRVETLSAALAFLGMDGIKQILVFNVFKGVTSFLGVQKEVLDHGRACAHLAGFLATKAKADRMALGKVRLAGLLHDIGSFALAFYHPKDFEKVRSLIREGKKRSCEAEMEVFSIDHPELGRRLLEKWGFPEYLSKVVANHHSLQDPSWDSIAGPVFCANGFLNQCVEGIPPTPFYQKLRTFFGQLEEKISTQELLDSLKKEYDSFISSGGLAPD